MEEIGGKENPGTTKGAKDHEGFKGPGIIRQQAFDFAGNSR
jgi:hypothetical protein